MNSDENKRMIADALLGLQLYGVQRQAVEFICASVTRWTGAPFERGQTLPIFENGKCMKPPMASPRGEDPVEVTLLLLAAQLENRTDIKARLARIGALAEAMLDFRKALIALPLDEQARLDLVNPRWEWDTNLKVVSALGVHNAFLAAIDAASSSIKRILSEEQGKLEKLPKERGRARFEAAYGVALEFAKIYSIVTGKRPSYADNENGLHGEFTPCLAELFKILGWGDKSLRRPAQEALRSLSDAEIGRMRAAQMGLFGSLLLSSRQ